MGSAHVRVWRSLGHTVVGVVDPDERVRDRLPPDLDYYPTLGDLDRNAVPGRPEAVSICTPTAYHRDTAIEAMGLGYHCLIEKPVAPTVADAEAIRVAADKAGVVVGVGQVERFNPAVSALKVALDAGELGEVFSMSSRRWSSMPGRVQDVGVLLDLGIHDLDVMRYLVGREPVSVYAVVGGDTEVGDGVVREDRGSVVLDWGDGISGVVEVSWRVPRKVRELAVTGSRGLARLDFMAQRVGVSQSAWVGLEPGGWGGSPEVVERTLPVRGGEPLALELGAFADAVSGDSNHLVGLADGIGSLRLALAAVESAKSGQPFHLR